MTSYNSLLLYSTGVCYSSRKSVRKVENCDDVVLILIPWLYCRETICFCFCTSDRILYSRLDQSIDTLEAENSPNHKKRKRITKAGHYIMFYLTIEKSRNF